MVEFVEMGGEIKRSKLALVEEGLLVEYYKGTCMNKWVGEK